MSGTTRWAIVWLAFFALAGLLTACRHHDALMMVPPTGVTATAGDGQVTLTWSPAMGAAGYNVYWSPSAGVTSGTGTLEGQVQSPHAVGGLANGTPYYFVVTAVNGGLESAEPKEVSATPLAAAPAPAWTWVKGANTVNAKGIYGTQGSPAPASTPGARYGSASWIDGGGHLWLFAGYGYDGNGTAGALNDLWKFDGTNWIWVGGGKTVNVGGVYCCMGIADPSNAPGARDNVVSVRDAAGNLWLFGGYGYDSSGTLGELNDLWKFDPASGMWTWISGSDLINQPGTYGSQGVAAPANIPGGRYQATGWIDGSGTFWLFGGYGRDGTGATGVMNDVWKWDGTNWTWIAGSKLANGAATYGTLGTANTANVPGGRDYSVSWYNSSGGKLLLMGGHGYDGSSTLDLLNDLWSWTP